MKIWAKKMLIMFPLLTLLCVSAPGMAFGLTWATLSPMPTARERLTVVAEDGLLYAIGGFGGANSRDSNAITLPQFVKFLTLSA